MAGLGELKLLLVEPYSHPSLTLDKLCTSSKEWIDKITSEQHVSEQTVSGSSLSLSRLSLSLVGFQNTFEKTQWREVKVCEWV